MNHKRVAVFVSPPAILITIASLIAAACNMPRPASGRDLASTSQALAAATAYSPGHGARRVVYDHEYTFDMMLGSNGLRMQLAAHGYVPLNATAVGEGPMLCGGETLVFPYEQLSGSSTIALTGSATYFIGDEGCTCTFSDAIEVEAAAKTEYEMLHADDQCETEVIFVQLQETWYTNPNWDCSCDDPDDNAFAEQGIMTQLAPFPNPELGDVTIKFNYLCPGTHLDAPFTDPTGFGTGTYRWVWRPGFDEPADPGRRVPTQSLYQLDETIFPEGQPSCLGAARAEWGPPLDSIIQPVAEWFPPP